jgi:hypothetical protein
MYITLSAREQRHDLRRGAAKNGLFQNGLYMTMAFFGQRPIRESESGQWPFSTAAISNNGLFSTTAI